MHNFYIASDADKSADHLNTLRHNLVISPFTFLTNFPIISGHDYMTLMTAHVRICRNVRLCIQE